MPGAGERLPGTGWAAGAGAGGGPCGGSGAPAPARGTGPAAAGEVALTMGPLENLISPVSFSGHLLFPVVWKRVAAGSYWFGLF